MRRYQGSGGGERRWLDRSEIEELIEAELRQAGLYPTPGTPVDVERFVEAHIGAGLDQHAALEAEVLGCTEFRPGRPPRILVNRDLTGAAMDTDSPHPGLQGRWRATVAHEAAHVVLHRDLIEPRTDQTALFVEDSARIGGSLRCLKREVAFGPQARQWDWREVQANLGMAALLMPQTGFVKVAEDVRSQVRPGSAPLQAGTDGAHVLAGRLAYLFWVSRQAASIRLETLGFIRPAAHAALPL